MPCWIHNRVRGPQRAARSAPTVIHLGGSELRSSSQVIQTGTRSRSHVRPYARASFSSRGWVAARFETRDLGSRAPLPPATTPRSPIRAGPMATCLARYQGGNTAGCMSMPSLCAAICSAGRDVTSSEPTPAHLSPWASLGQVGFVLCPLILACAVRSVVCHYARVQPRDPGGRRPQKQRRRIGTIGTR